MPVLLRSSTKTANSNLGGGSEAYAPTPPDGRVWRCSTDAEEPTRRYQAVVTGAALVNHGLSQQTAADGVLVFAGIPTAVVAVVAAVNLWRDQSGAAQT
jgi:hypothetical protein